MSVDLLSTQNTSLAPKKYQQNGIYHIINLSPSPRIGKVSSATSSPADGYPHCGIAPPSTSPWYPLFPCGGDLSVGSVGLSLAIRVCSGWVVWRQNLQCHWHGSILVDHVLMSKIREHAGEVFNMNIVLICGYLHFLTIETMDWSSSSQFTCNGSWSVDPVVHLCFPAFSGRFSAL